MVNQTCIKLFLPDLVDGFQHLGFLAASGRYGRGGCATGSQCQQGDRCAGKGEECASVQFFHGVLLSIQYSIQYIIDYGSQLAGSPCIPAPLQIGAKFTITATV